MSCVNFCYLYVRQRDTFPGRPTLPEARRILIFLLKYPGLTFFMTLFKLYNINIDVILVYTVSLTLHNQPQC